jgi:lysophospholipase L1-like esterase
MTQSSSKFSKLVLDSLLGLVLTVAILGGIEAALWAMGLGEAEKQMSYSRGFDPTAAYLVPNPDIDGGWETRFNSRGRKEIKVPPKSGKARVLIFGGSNTAGCPIWVLDRRLKNKQPRNSYEAINLGRQGYGSARVRLILEQAVEKIAPDVLVIYAGHNEFIEKSFEMDLQEAGLGDWSAKPLELAGNTRTFQAIYSHYADSYVPPQVEPEAWKSEYTKFAHLSYEQTQVFFDKYEQNLRAMCRTALDNGVEIMLCTIVYNRLAAPFSSSLPKGLTDEQVREFYELHRMAEGLLPKYLGPLLTNNELERLQNRDWGPNGVGYEPAKDVLESSRPCRAILKDQDPMLETEKTWTPKVRQLDSCLKLFWARDMAMRSRAQIERAESLLTQALEICPDHPRALFELAVVKYLLGRGDIEVLELFEQAATYDRAPRKGSEAINDIIRKVANDMEGVDLYDIDTLYRACHPGGLISYEFMVDYCHLSFGGRWLLMELVGDRIFELWPPEHFNGTGEPATQGGSQ